MANKLDNHSSHCEDRQIAPLPKRSRQPPKKVQASSSPTKMAVDSSPALDLRMGSLKLRSSSPPLPKTPTRRKRSKLTVHFVTPPKPASATANFSTPQARKKPRRSFTPPGAPARAPLGTGLEVIPEDLEGPSLKKAVDDFNSRIAHVAAQVQRNKRKRRDDDE
ncbi:hypothetical protein CVT24_008393 [Panaeolus cyanescens]|uniref:Uncharacterized protein n=1 Tax=Panaeolus cyanescens TaxID=181874 RepID=A0A409VL28_9AGAR|nr:hypothetical protein CVT24_008393 [Panaeolus cyanescens]